MSRSSIVRVWIAAGALLAIVLGSLTYSANVNSDDAIPSNTHHDAIPPFRG